MRFQGIAVCASYFQALKSGKQVEKLGYVVDKLLFLKWRCHVSRGFYGVFTAISGRNVAHDAKKEMALTYGILAGYQSF